MAHPVYYVPAGDVLPVFFASYDGATGASEAISGLAVTDIEIYKDGSVTQRASDAGYTLLDTDGIDFDSIAGINGFSIDTGDNTDASFYTVGAWFTVVVSAITADTQTVNFIACQFRIMAAEGVAGVPDVNVTHLVDDAQSATDLKDFADAGYDPSTNKVQGVVLTDTVTTYTGNTVQTGDAYAVVNSGTHGNAALKTLIDTIDDFLDLEIAAILEDTGTTLDDFLDLEVAQILADTNELQTDWANGGRLDLLIDAIKAKTDPMTYTVANELNANTRYVAGTALTGTGTTGDEWGPA